MELVMAKAHPDMSQVDASFFLREKQILASKFPVSRSHWRAGCKKGIYPAGIRISERITLWLASDIDKFLNDVAAV